MEVDLWVDLEPVCRKQKQLLSTQQVPVFYIVERGLDGRWPAGWFLISSGLEVFNLPESSRHGLETLRCSHPAVGINSSRHEGDAERMELSSLAEGSPHPVITRTW